MNKLSDLNDDNKFQEELNQNLQISEMGNYNEDQLKIEMSFIFEFKFRGFARFSNDPIK